MKTYTLKIVTPMTCNVENDVVKTIVKAVSGNVGIMAGHIPYVSPLKDGEVRIVFGDGSEKLYTSEDGIIKVGQDGIVILAQNAKLSE